MTRSLLALMLVPCFIGCSDMLYEDAPEQQKSPQGINHVIDAGTPVSEKLAVAHPGPVVENKEPILGDPPANKPVPEQPKLEQQIEKDVTPPDLEISFAGEHEKEKMFAILDGNIFFNVVAKDDSGTATIKVKAPSLEKSDGENVFGPIATNHIQDSVGIAKECEVEDKFTADIKEQSIDAKNVICACFEASDTNKNFHRKLACFQRRLPTSTIELPSNGSKIRPKTFYRGVHIKANISSGADIAECSWAIRTKESRIARHVFLPKGLGKISSNNCVIDEMVAAQLPEGKYSLAVYAKDVAGRTIHDGQDVAGEDYVNFRVAR